MTTLRQRIREIGICCQPWKQYRGEIRLLPISAQCLFSNKGLSWDILEIELKLEGWLFEHESLWNVLSDSRNLKRKLHYSDLDGSPFDETWTDEDYKNFYKNNTNI